ncbi:MAG: hypothetical protein MJ142_02650 [Clostridia bacterium]|nr:hypothetical protein [Clostridia bacterium]
MYLISEVDHSECPVLRHGPDVFTQACRCGAERIHVLMPGGEDYDLVHIRNADYRPDFIRNRWKDEACYPEYRTYSVAEKSSLYLDFFRVFRTVYISSVNEYTVALTEVMLRYTRLTVFSLDERIRRFFGERVPVFAGAEIPRERDVLVIGDLSADLVFDVSFHRIGPVCAFHNVFFLQGQGVLSLSGYSYAELAIDGGAGIGSVLNNLYRFGKAVSGIGLTPVVRGRTVGHFSTAFLEKYFNLRLTAPDAGDANTVYFPEMSTLSSTMFLDWVRPELDLSILSEAFLSDMKEYADAVIGEKRLLGVLIRGTDYVVVHKDGPRKMAGAADMIPMIREWMDSYGYDGIFLATEDRDILAEMRSAFGDDVKVIAQERHSVADLDGRKLLAELEKENAADYEGSVAESTVNYFYALYMLSRCAAFICSGACNGYDLAVGFNGGNYERVYLFKNR